MIKSILAACALLLSLSVKAQIWVDTKEVGLRSDIETLADIGVIKVPVTTYPLMWAGIIKDIDNTGIEQVPLEYKALYWRVKKAGRRAFSGKEKRLLKLSGASTEQIFRTYGDTSRARGELSASYSNTSKYFAWNVQVNRVANPFDDDDIHYDGSYVAAITGNWVTSVGKVEKWWGASWDSANLLSNNARSPLAVSFDRNYPDAIDSPWFSWVGPFNISGYVGQLDDNRFISEPTLAGFSLAAKPLKGLEIGLRTTAISSGSYIELDPEVSTELDALRDNKQINGLDVRWSLPLFKPTSLYASVTDEDQESSFASRLFGLSSAFELFQQNWRIILESSKTYPDVDYFDTSYEDDYYQSGYRYNHRAIGSTYDSDSKVLTFSLLGNLNRYQSLQIKIQEIKINQQGNGLDTDSRHSISTKEIAVKRILINWDFKATRNHRFNLGVEVTDELINWPNRKTEKVRASASWSYYL